MRSDVDSVMMRQTIGSEPGSCRGHVRRALHVMMGAIKKRAVVSTTDARDGQGLLTRKSSDGGCCQVGDAKRQFDKRSKGAAEDDPELMTRRASTSHYLATGPPEVQQNDSRTIVWLQSRRGPSCEFFYGPIFVLLLPLTGLRVERKSHVYAYCGCEACEGRPQACCSRRSIGVRVLAANPTRAWGMA